MLSLALFVLIVILTFSTFALLAFAFWVETSQAGDGFAIEIKPNSLLGFIPEGTFNI